MNAAEGSFLRFFLHLRWTRSACSKTTPSSLGLCPTLPSDRCKFMGMTHPKNGCRRKGTTVVMVEGWRSLHACSQHDLVAFCYLRQDYVHQNRRQEGGTGRCPDSS